MASDFDNKIIKIQFHGNERANYLRLILAQKA